MFSHSRACCCETGSSTSFLNQLKLYNMKQFGKSLLFGAAAVLLIWVWIWFVLMSITLDPLYILKIDAHNWSILRGLSAGLFIIVSIAHRLINYNEYE